MSCFIVKDECLIDVMTIIKKYQPELIKTLTDNDFLNKLSELNITAYNQRYMENNEIEKKNYTQFESNRHELTMLFNLISYCYQCDEGEIADNDLYKKIKDLSENLLIKFDQKYIMGSEMKHERSIENAYNALQLYMKNNKIEFVWGS